MTGNGRAPIGLEMSALRGGEYGDYARTPILDLLDRPLGTVLDVGCARGGGESAMRSRGAERICGIEIDEEYAAAARERYDEVVTGSADGDLPWAEGTFDTILCYDVLEHTYDPWSIVRRLNSLLRRGGRLHVSLPNSRNLDFWKPLLMKGTFGYAPHGLRDVTHIRFFTRRDLVDMLEVAGFDVIRVDSTGGTSRKREAAMRATRGRAVEFFAYQWIALASTG
jgi:2-polyprenyl-3-methyl-5-hydroxy-6-metoxy-1,4-benzoquinol methylase